MTFDDNVLNRLAPAGGWTSDWANVLERAEVGERRLHLRLASKRRLVVALALIALALIPVIAVAAHGGWWFMQEPGNDLNSPAVVTQGSWDGHPWQLVVAWSQSMGLCTSLDWTDTSANSVTEDNGRIPDSMACGPFAGFPAPGNPGVLERTIETGGGWAKGLPAYVLGEVVNSATQVEIRFDNGHDPVSLATIAAPSPFDHVRFFVAAMPNDLQSHIWETAGLDDSGNVVACASNDDTHAGISPISVCE